jgi:hypothetical protein
MAETVSFQRTPVGCARGASFDTSAFRLPNSRVAEKLRQKKQQQAELEMREMLTETATSEPESQSIDARALRRKVTHSENVIRNDPPRRF